MKEKRFKKIYVEITNICNLKCSFCPDGKRKKESMCVEDFEYIAKQICEYTNLIALHVKGEPLIHPNLKEILQICEKYNLKVNITTNATLLEKNLEIIMNSKAVRQLNLSLHSVTKNENTNQYNFEKYVEDVIKLSKIILEKTNIIISYRLWNLENLQENDENIQILKYLEEAFKITNLKEIAKKEKFVKLSENAFLNQDFEFTWPNIDGEIISEVGKCWGLRNQIAILVNGDVVPCCLDQDGEIKLGNIFDESFFSIINSELSREIIQGFENNKITHNLCKRCGYRTKFEKSKN